MVVDPGTRSTVPPSRAGMMSSAVDGTPAAPTPSVLPVRCQVVAGVAPGCCESSRSRRHNGMRHADITRYATPTPQYLFHLFCVTPALRTENRFSVTQYLF